MATHDRIEALRLSDRIGIMNNGNLCQIGPPEDVMNRPADEFVASFVGTETILSGQVLENSGGDISISVADRKLWAVGEAMAGDAVLLCIRPENVILAKGSNPSVTSARNTFLGMIEKIIPAGVYYKVKIDCSFPLVAFITRQAIEELSLQEGSTVTASFKATAIHVIRRHMSN
jgi:tungstate transport system ATP-binding protein